MIITCAISPPPIAYIDPDGKRKQLVLRPGEHNYPMLKPAEDPLLAETLFSLRKIKRISFNDLLPRDKEILKDCPKGVKPGDHLAKKVFQKPSPVGREVNEKSEAKRQRQAAQAKKKAEAKAKEASKNARGDQTNAPPASATGKDADNSGKPRDIPGKK